MHCQRFGLETRSEINRTERSTRAIIDGYVTCSRIGIKVRISRRYIIGAMTSMLGDNTSSYSRFNTNYNLFSTISFSWPEITRSERKTVEKVHLSGSISQLISTPVRSGRRWFFLFPIVVLQIWWEGAFTMTICRQFRTKRTMARKDLRLFFEHIGVRQDRRTEFLN